MDDLSTAQDDGVSDADLIERPEDVFGPKKNDISFAFVGLEHVPCHPLLDLSLTKYVKNGPSSLTKANRIDLKRFRNVHRSSLNANVYLGMSILDISKTLMFDMHYNFIKKKFDANLLFTDTDSLAYEVKLDNIKRDMFTKYDDLSDTSTYRANSKYHHKKNKAVFGVEKTWY
ncbi:hypothetical protein CAPTEDRAFT_194761 [Capitella teleta]|uniref:Uncharacterized protein n=1 Tax=Capitella teleta TaxID=283909 RepID=R7UC96_CAPTE|nr:hypothetical protein CAPTEDRAFT_194761 [Capitella teleta]|eukprot:ELU03741.1 hypothetical protein CAPTEDRAFT_194761 [Capitella teleta]